MVGVILLVRGVQGGARLTCGEDVAVLGLGVLGWRRCGFVRILWLRAALLGGENSAGCSLRSGGCNNYCGAGVWRRLVMSRHR